MDARTLEALEKSIAHHEKNARASRPSYVTFGCSVCALCTLFREGNCEGCPVAERTGRAICDGSPYEACIDARNEWARRYRNKHLRELFVAAEQREIDFLKSLRPAKADLGEVAAFVGAALIVGQLLFWGQIFA